MQQKYFKKLVTNLRMHLDIIAKIMQSLAILDSFKNLTFTFIFQEEIFNTQY